PIDGSGPAVRLNAPLAAGALDSFAVSPDGANVYFDGDPQGVTGIYRVPSDASSAPVALATSDVGHTLALSGDGQWVVYQGHAATQDLYSVPANGSSAPVRLNAVLAAGRSVKSFGISPNSSRVVFLADAVSAGVNDVYSAPIDGSAAALHLSNGSQGT